MQNPNPLQRAIQTAALDLQARFAELTGPKEARRAAAIFYAALSPHRTPGRKPARPVDVAAKLKAEGKPWHLIYETAIPSYWARTPAERRHLADNLRTAVRARRKRADAPKPNPRPE